MERPVIAAEFLVHIVALNDVGARDISTSFGEVPNSGEGTRLDGPGDDIETADDPGAVEDWADDMMETRGGAHEVEKITAGEVVGDIMQHLHREIEEARHRIEWVWAC